MTPADASQPGVAFYGATESYKTPAQLAEDAQLTLTHAVAKVTLNTMTALTDGKIATLSVPTCISFNLISGEATGEGTSTDTSEGATSNDLCSVYVLCNDADDLPAATITLSNGQEKDITSLPMKRNNHIKLQGDVDGIRTTGSLDFKVYLEGDWNETDKIFLPAEVDAENHIITTKDAGQIAEKPTLITEAMGAEGILKVVGPMNQADMDAISANQATITELDLSGATGEIKITDRAFSGLGNATVSLQRLKLGNNVTSIGYAAFARNASLREVDLSACSNLTLIDASAFGSCSGITNLKLPMNGKLEAIGTSAFMNSDNIKSITFPETLKQIGDCIFNKTNIKTLVFLGQEPPLIAKYDDVTDLGNFTDLFYASDKMSNVTIYLPNVQSEDADAKGWTAFFVDESNYSGVKYGSPATENP